MACRLVPVSLGWLYLLFVDEIELAVAAGEVEESVNGGSAKLHTGFDRDWFRDGRLVVNELLLDLLDFIRILGGRGWWLLDMARKRDSR